MVKADPTRNYYADLKVPATASESEIRKAFRTLALQYHPDRNPGREADFVVKFQEIQAAHEILSDQAQRAKYDAERRKYRNLNIPLNTPNTPRTRPPPPPRNTFTTTNPAGTYYRAPPPKPAPPPQRPPPPQQHGSYASGADRFTSKNFRAPPTAQRPQDARTKDADAKANVFSAWQKMKQPRAADESRGAQNRQPSSNNQGQQSNPNGTPFGRSQSTRVPSSRKGFDPGTPGGDEGQAKSAYRNYTRPAPTPPSSTTPPKHPTPPSRDPPPEEVPYFEGNRMRTPYFSSAAGERTSMFEGLGRSASVRNSPTRVHHPSYGADPGSYSDSGRRQQRNSYAGRSTNPFAHMYADSSDDESESEVFQTGRKHEGPPPTVPPQKPPTSPPIWMQNGFGASPIPRRTSNGASGNFPSSFKSRSEESINMKFSPSEWHGKFEGSGDYFMPNLQKGASARGRTSPTRGRPNQRSATERNPQANGSMGPPPVSSFSQPQEQYSSFPIPPPPPGPPPTTSFQPLSNVTANPTKFRPEDWANTFREPSWALPDQKETSPRRATETAKRPNKPPRKASVTQDKRPKPRDQHDTTRTKPYQASVDDMINGDTDADAMDIDSNTPPVSSKDSAKMGPRSPQWEQPLSTHPNGSDAKTSSTIDPKASTSAWHGLGSMAKDDLFTSARDSSEGGIALDDLGQTLPYESQASNMHPTKPSTAQKLKFPSLPRPPQPPPKLDQVFADLYFSQFEVYVKEYRKASKQMTAHFVARDAEVDDMDHRFVHRRGETSKSIGFSSYLARMKEDEQVLETWKVFQEAHLSAVGQCEEIRNKTIKLYPNPSG